jgi:hypothetical protein
LRRTKAKHPQLRADMDVHVRMHLMCICHACAQACACTSTCSCTWRLHDSGVTKLIVKLLWHTTLDKLPRASVHLLADAKHDMALTFC